MRRWAAIRAPSLLRPQGSTDPKRERRRLVEKHVEALKSSVEPAVADGACRNLKRLKPKTLPALCESERRNPKRLKFIL